jgi:hypothetical protein
MAGLVPRLSGLFRPATSNAMSFLGFRFKPQDGTRVASIASTVIIRESG